MSEHPRGIQISAKSYQEAQYLLSSTVTLIINLDNKIKPCETNDLLVEQRTLLFSGKIAFQNLKFEDPL